MKKALAIAGILALTITPRASLADHLEPKESGIRPGGDLFHTNLRGRNLSGADLSDANVSFSSLSSANLSGADLSGANLSGADLSGAELRDITATNISGCPISLPRGWVCQNNSLIQP